MNSTGLFIALAVAAVVGVAFGVYPQLDLDVSALFFDASTRTFPARPDLLASLPRMPIVRADFG